MHLSPLRVLLLLASSLPVAAESLWTAPGSAERSMYADRKASRIGDILTVVVQETAATQSSQTKKTNSAANVDAGVEQFLFPVDVSRLGTHKGALPSIKLGGSNDFNGGGEVNNTQSLNARAAVLVTDVLPNGNLVIEGVRRVVSSGETQHVILHGLVRADDVSSVNTVFSSNIADARVEFINEGSLTDAQKKGWLTKLYEKLRPY
ncbi:MAG TPA: flagellar basal body L-ring protein FlgH [Opitutaceae bacterium]|nr:flagellar basal body L-ring protein FlgH [Opitutaceae bacterium]HRE07249.1 flagellar basal body L-ring protein FlgH [Opitutaceae bacterium]